MSVACYAVVGDDSVACLVGHINIKDDTFCCTDIDGVEADFIHRAVGKAEYVTCCGKTARKCVEVCAGVVCVVEHCNPAVEVEVSNAAVTADNWAVEDYQARAVKGIAVVARCAGLVEVYI